jgi:predicted nucleotidyltransferase
MREEIIKQLKFFFENNADRHRLEMAFLYGSWAKGIPRPDSDIDLAIVFSPEPSTDDESYERLTDISLFLSTELKKEVNIIQIHEDFRKPMLYYNAIVKGIPFYVKDYSKFLALRKESIDQMEDYEIFGRDWQLIIARRNLEDLGHARI